MSKISIDLIWKLDEGILAPGKYSNKHEIKFTSEKSIIADSAPDWQGDSKNINPEQTLAASLSSCHMMTFLALAAKMGWPVLSYTDNAIATLGKNLEGKMSVTSIELNPKIKFDLIMNDMDKRIGWMPIENFKFRNDLSKKYIVNANWALYCDNYLEGFHIPFVHEGLNSVFLLYI